MDSNQPSRNSQDGFNLPSIAVPSRQQIFGESSNNGSPTMPDFTFDDIGMDGLDRDGGQEEGNDAKRRRIARACDMCRKKKIKCDGKMPACSHCINYKTECIFTQVEKKRNPPKGAKYIEGLENRLGRMESLLKLSGLIGEEDGDRTDLGTLERRLADRAQNGSKPGTPIRTSGESPASNGQTRQLISPHSTPRQEKEVTPQANIVSPELPKQREGPEVEELSDMMCSLVTNNCGETRYIGSSSGFSIFSPLGVQWVNDKTGDSSFQDMIATAAVHDVKWAYWKPEVFGDMFARRTFQHLPPRDEALSLLKDFFENFNCMFPLFHEPTFMHLVNRQYSRDPYEGSGWWASLNVALAIAHRLRVMSNLVPQDEDRKAWGFLKNAMGVLTELTMRNTDLLSVQALLGMALFLLGTPNPQPSFFLVAAAIRLANSIGLHKRGTAFNLNAVEIEQRKRVFWIAYLLDKDICLRSGRPPAQDDDDMNVDLPSEDPSDNIGNIPLADGKGKVNIFRFMCNFAIIESKVYKQLYSAKASKQSDGALLNTIGELDRELEEWKDKIPIDFRPEHEIKASHTPLILHIVVLHFAYYNCLTTIHRMSVHHGYWTSRLSNYAIQGLNARPLNPRVFSSAALCVQAARASIHLIRYIPQGDYSCVWLIIYFPVSALVTLFANILQNPHDVRAKSDVKLMNQVVNFLSLLAVTEEQGGVKRMLHVCAEFERIARVVLERSDKEANRRKRKSSRPPAETEGTTNQQIPQQQQQQQQQQQPQQVPQKRSASNAATPRSNENVAPSPNVFSPGFTGELNNGNSGFTPNLQGFSPSLSSMNIPLEYSNNNNLDFQNFPGMTNGMGGLGFDPGDMSQFTVDGSNDNNNAAGAGASPLNMGSFQQPFVPQALWQMPMTLEWDWADMPPVNGLEGDQGMMGQGQGQQQPPQ